MSKSSNRKHRQISHDLHIFMVFVAGCSVSRT